MMKDLTIWIDIVKNIVITVTTIITGSVAIAGLNKWKNEYLGKKEMEFGEDILCQIYEVKDKISMIRSSQGTIEEGKTRIVRENETPEETRIHNTYFLTVERFNKNIEIFNKFESAKYKYFIYFDDINPSPMDRIRIIIKRIMSSARMLDNLSIKLMRCRENTSEKVSEDLLKKIENHEKIVWDRSFEQEDEINKEIDLIVKEVENKIRAKLKIKIEKRR